MWAIALFITAAPVVAQNNTFNMVITMANGTTITIGPNEVKNITFNEGQVVVSGENLDKIVELAGNSNVRIDSLGHVLSARLAALEDKISELSQSGGGGSAEDIDILRNEITELKKSILTLEARQAMMETALEKEKAERQGLLAALKVNFEDELNNQRAYLDEKITILYDRISYLESLHE